jgi:hypothetical protein
MEEMTRATVSAGSGEWTRVIVLTSRGECAGAEHAGDEPDKPPLSAASPGVHSAGALPESLRDAFAARDWFAVVHDDPYLALADLAVRDITQTARAAWGLQRLERLALVIVQPSVWPEAMLNDLVDAAARHLPNASIWHARDGQITPAMMSPGEPVKPRGRAPALRDTPAPAALRDGAAADATAPAGERCERISRAEIDMLLKADDSAGAPGEHPEDLR